MAYRIGIKKFSKKIREIGSEVEASIIKGLQSSAFRMAGLVAESIESAKPRAAVNTGELKRSIRTEMTAKGAIVSVDAPHAAWVEYGTRPHRPPLQPMEDWVKQKGIASDPKEIKQIARAIAESIAINGTKPRFYMKRAVGKLYRLKVLDQEIGRELDDLAIRRLR
jgi:hypothetical protein